MLSDYANANTCDGWGTLDPLCLPYYISRHEELHVGRFMKLWQS